MAETAPGSYGADLRSWDPRVRRTASLVVLALAVLIIGACIVVYLFAASQADWFLVVAIVALALLLLFQVAQLVIDAQRAKGTGPAWMTGAAGAAAPRSVYAPPEGPSAGPPRVELRCPECGRTFTAPDTGERPLTAVCPHCGAEGQVDLAPLASPEPSPTAPVGIAAEPLESPPPTGEVITLKCPACGTQFEVQDTGARPLRAACPGCGRSGRLR